MAKRLFANGVTGLVAISEPNANLTTPLSNLQNIYFHSALNYLFVKQTISGSVNLPFRQFNGSDVSSAFGSTVYNLGAHNLGYTPLVFGYFTSSGQSLVGETILQAAGTADIRTLMLGADNVNLYAREIYVNKTTSFNAITVNFTVQLLNDPGV
jgi:hypothetical protein